MDKSLLRDAQLRIGDAIACVQAALDDLEGKEDEHSADRSAHLEQALEDLKDADSQIEEAMQDLEVNNG